MFSDLHYSIARELISCANKHELIAYKDLHIFIMAFSFPQSSF